MNPPYGAYRAPLRPGLAIGLSLALAAACYLAQAYVADSPYWMGLAHRPLTVALLAAASLVDWSREMKIVVILGASLPVMLDSAPAAAPAPRREPEESLDSGGEGGPAPARDVVAGGCSMTLDDARDDLAFMRSLVTVSEESQKTLGQAYATGGLCYGVQMLLHGAQFLGWLPASDALAMTIGFGPTVVFVALQVWLLSRAKPQAPTVVNRAMAAVFSAAGLVNLLMIAIIGSIAWRLHSLTVWLIYPCLVMIMQGLAWRVAFALRRRSWMLAVAIGWFLTGLGMGAAIFNIGAYIIVTGVGLIAFMLIPGLIMLRQARRADA